MCIRDSALAVRYLEEHPFLTVYEYRKLTGLLRTAATNELRQWAYTPGSGTVSYTHLPVNSREFPPANGSVKVNCYNHNLQNEGSIRRHTPFSSRLWK